jgi:hypothetical protein
LNTFTIPITAFTGSDNVAVTGYLITLSVTQPSANDAGWDASAPATYTVGSDGSYLLYPWVEDAAGNISAVYGSPASVSVDTTNPTVTAFTATSPANSLTIPITAFSASDNAGVTGYLITASSTPPTAGAAGWAGSAPTIYTAGGEGSYLLYPWVKDAAGNISAAYGSPASVRVDTTKPTVTAFTAASPTNSLTFPITIFTASDTVGVIGYIITESPTPPAAAAAGWVGLTPLVYTVTGDGTYTLFPWAKDAAGNVSAVYGSPATVSVETTAPTVVSSTRANTDPMNAASASFTVTFNESVTGVDISDFSVTSSGLTGVSIAAVSGGPKIYTVGVNTGSGSGTLRLNLLDNDSIIDSASNPLGGSGLANGNFITGQAYTIDKTAPTAGSLVAPNVTLSGGTIYSFTVTFSDNLAIDRASLSTGDIRVTGPGGISQLATFVDVTPAGNSTSCTATYRITAPGGSWGTGDNGTYTIALEANHVFDSAGNPVRSGSLGSFLVKLNDTTYLPLVLR